MKNLKKIHILFALIAIIALITTSVCATFVLMWTSSQVTEDLTVEGMSAYLLENTLTGYDSKTTATTLTDITVNDITYHGFVFCLDETQVTNINGDLTLSVVDDGSNIDGITVTWSAYYGAYWMNTEHHLTQYDQIGTNQSLGGEVSIPNALIADRCVWVDIDNNKPSPVTISDSNAVLIVVSFDYGSSSWGDYTLRLKVQAGETTA